MRLASAAAVGLFLVAGCTPAIPVEPGFGTSALVAVGDIPPEFAEFNSYDARVNRLLADQLCATAVVPMADRNFDASPGQFVQAASRCRTHIPLVDE